MTPRGFDYYGYVDAGNCFRFRMGTYDPLFCTGWSLRSRKESVLEAISAIHEFFAHPKMLHDFNNLIYETLIQAFLDGGQSVYQRWLDAYRPLVEGTALAKIYVTKPDLYDIAHEASDLETRDIAEKLISIHSALLQLRSHSSEYPLVEELTSGQSLKPEHGVSTSIMEQLASYAVCLSYSFQLPRVGSFGDPRFHKHAYPRYSALLDFLSKYLWAMKKGEVPLGEEKPRYLNIGLYRFWFTLEMASLIQNGERTAKMATMSLLANLVNVCRNIIMYLVKEDDSKFPITRRRPLFYNLYYHNALLKELGEALSKPSQTPTSYLSLFSFVKNNSLWELSNVAARSSKSGTLLYEKTIETMTRYFSQISDQYKLWKLGRITVSDEATFYKNNFGVLEKLSTDQESFWYGCCQRAIGFLESFNPTDFKRALSETFNSVLEEDIHSIIIEDFDYAWTEITHFPLDVQRKIVGQIAFDIDGLAGILKDDGLSVNVEKIRRDYESGNVNLLP